MLCSCTHLSSNKESSFQLDDIKLKKEKEKLLRYFPSVLAPISPSRYQWQYGELNSRFLFMQVMILDDPEQGREKDPQKCWSRS